MAIGLEVEKLKASYQPDGNNVTALEDISFSLEPGETCAIVGPSGCGKSTLIHALANLVRYNSTPTVLDGKIIWDSNPRIGTVFQEHTLLPWKTIFENVALGLRVGKFKNIEIQKRLSPVLGDLGLAGLEDRYPSQISGGQRHRASIARSLALNPGVLLMDEPFSSLDALTREKLQDLYIEIWKKHSITTLIVTHNIEEAVCMGSKIIVLEGPPGKIRGSVDNPMFGQEGLRDNQDFYKLCIKIRLLLEGK